MASKNGKKCIIERRPKMLKDYLQDNSTPSYSSSPSCSSSSFKSIPRRLPKPDPTVKNLLDQAAATLPRSRSRSRAAAEAAVSSFQKLLNVVKIKSLSFSSTPSSPTSPLTLTRSISKRLIGTWSGEKKRESKSGKEGIMSKVKVKDILRWKSFRDLELPKSAEYNNDDIVFQEDTSVTTKRSSITSSNGSRSSWGESEFSFTAGELPCWWGKSCSEEWNKENNVVATESEMGPNKEDNCSMASEEDKEQHSPVSVLNSPFREETSDEEFVSSFDQSLANVERAKQSLLERIQWFESLAGGFEEDDEIEAVKEEEQEHKVEQSREGNAITVTRKVYLSKEFCRLKGGAQGLMENQECVKDMEKQGQWSKFKEELGVEMEVDVLSDLVNEVLVDLFG